jgi:4-alpha-glucanotransferase
MHAVHDFTAFGGEPRLDLADQAAIRTARSAARIDHARVRLAKEHALRMAFSQFWDAEWVRGTARAGAFAAFCAWEEWWLADYALYRALREKNGGLSWTDWDEPLRRRDSQALSRAREELETEILFYQYLQWLADEQWQDAREASAVALFGDFPFMVAADSADVWSRQHLFRFDATVGTPPDAFSATGQDWGLPVYRWDVMERDDYRWLRERARRSARLFDGYRIDHLVGFYRTFSRPLDSAEGSFDPPEEEDQIALGERLMAIFTESRARIIAEDLGLVPDFVRESLAALRIPGYKVLRWERDWEADGRPFIDPAEYPPLSVATSGTHDTDPIATWWETAAAAEREAFAELPAVAPYFATTAPATAPFTPALRDVILRALYASASNLVLVPFPDIFGWTDRINTPATVTDDNWTWRLPWAVDTLAEQAEARERLTSLRAWAEETGRLTTSVMKNAK